jgi:hypothetical protein
MPLEGKALAVAVATVEPALMKEEPKLRHALEWRTPEKGGVPGTPQGVRDALEPMRLR